MDKIISGRLPIGESMLTEFLHRKAFASCTPISGNFELTARCNFNCRMCYVHQQNPCAGELSAAQWLELGEQLRDRGMLFVLLTGGEPLLRPDFKEIYLGLRKLGLMVSVNTNGSLITEDILQVFRHSPPSRVNVSLYGCSDQTYQRLCQNTAYHTVTENIRKLKHAGINVKLNATVNPYNAEDIEGIYQFGRELDISVRATAYMYPPVRVETEQRDASFQRFTPREAAACMLKFREQTMTTEQIRSLLPPPEDREFECAAEGGPMRCRAGRTSCWITWDGRLLPCGMFPTEGYSVLSMSFDGAWERVKEDVAKVVMPSACGSCNKADCCGVCAASCLAENGDTRKVPQYLCELTDCLEQMILEKYGR